MRRKPRTRTPASARRRREDAVRASSCGSCPKTKVVCTPKRCSAIAALTAECDGPPTAGSMDVMIRRTRTIARARGAIRPLDEAAELVLVALGDVAGVEVLLGVGVSGPPAGLQARAVRQDGGERGRQL